MKKLLSILLATVLVFSLAACGNNTPAPTPAPAPAPAAEEPAVEPAPAPEPAPEADADPGELNLAIFEGGAGPDFWLGAAAQFEALTGITVNMTISPDIGDIIRPQIVAGDVPDFMNLNTNDQTGITLAMQNENALMELTDVFNGPQFDSDAPLRDKITPGFLESLRLSPYGDGRIIFAPGSDYPIGPMYNITLFEEMGWSLPVTWDDFFALGELSKAEGIALFTYQGIYPGYLESILYPALASALGEADYEKISTNQPGIWTDPRTVAVMEQFERIYADGHLLRGTVGMNHTEAQAAQMMNQALFIPCGPWMVGEMAEADRAPGYRFGLTVAPVMKAGDPRFIASGLEQFSIPANAPNAENAKLFIRFLYTDDMIKLYAQSGAVMPTVNAFELAKGIINDDEYGCYGVYSQAGVAPLVFSVPDSTQLDDLTELMSGRWTALEYCEAQDAKTN
jgi:N-acetylglucosamine transport system substrate-binding protein